MKNKTLLFLLLLTGARLFSQSIITIGPMLHWNFGAGKRTTTFAIEAAYWNLDKFPYSVDAGIEFGGKKVRLYSELQTGIGVAGVSAGSVIEMGDGIKLGGQFTVWANYGVGIDYRYRKVNKQKNNCFGLYAKIPASHWGFDQSDGDWDWSDWDD